MSVTTTGISTNTKRIAYTAGESLANVIAAIEAALILMGWALHDASAGTNAYAYKTLNVDGVTYKYIVLDYNTTGYVLLKCYEDWNATTHAGTNLAYNSDATAQGQRLDLTGGGDMYLFATARYMVMMSSIPAGVGSSSGNGWTGVFEVERANAEDTAAAGYPPVIWASGFGLSNGNASNQYIISFCRTRGGGTGASASQYSMVGIMMHGWGALITSTAIAAYSVYAPNFTNIWSGGDYVSSMIAGYGGSTAGTQEIRGRIYGLNFIGRYGSGALGPCVDDITMKANANGWADPSGTNTDYWVMGASTNNGRFLIPK